MNLLLLPNINNTLSEIEGISSITGAYKAIVPKLHIAEVVGLATLFAVIIIIARMVGVIKDAYSDSEPMNVRKIFALCEEYIKVMAILVFAPFVFYYIELGFSYIQDALIAKFKGGENVLNVMLNAKEDPGTYLDTFYSSLLKGPMAAIELLLAFLLKYALFMVVAGRFLYLALLQIIQPFAIVAFLSEKTRHFTLKYIGHLGYTYLVIPMILIADVFSDEIAKLLLEEIGSVKIILLCVACILKFSLYKVANGICKNVMSI